MMLAHAAKRMSAYTVHLHISIHLSIHPFHMIHSYEYYYVPKDIDRLTILSVIEKIILSFLFSCLELMPSNHTRCRHRCRRIDSHPRVLRHRFVSTSKLDGISVSASFSFAHKVFIRYEFVLYIRINDIPRTLRTFNRICFYRFVFCAAFMVACNAIWFSLSLYSNANH